MATNPKHETATARKSQANPSTFLDRDNWMRAVLASGLPDSAVRVAIAIRVAFCASRPDSATRAFQRWRARAIWSSARSIDSSRCWSMPDGSQSTARAVASPISIGCLIPDSTALSQLSQG